MEVDEINIFVTENTERVFTLFQPTVWNWWNILHYELHTFVICISTWSFSNINLCCKPLICWVFSAWQTLKKKIVFQVTDFSSFAFFVLSTYFTKFIGVNEKLIVQQRLIQHRYSDRKQMNNDEVRWLDVRGPKTVLRTESGPLDASRVNNSIAL